MRRLAAAALVLAACSGDPSVNLAEEAALEQVQSIEVEVVQGGGEQRWLTITQPLAGEIAAELGADLGLVEPQDCDATFEVRFFVPGDDPLALAYGCNGRPLLWGDQPFWGDRMAEAPPAFVDLLAVQIALLGRL